MKRKAELSERPEAKKRRVDNASRHGVPGKKKRKSKVKLTDQYFRTAEASDDFIPLDGNQLKKKKPEGTSKTDPMEIASSREPPAPPPTDAAASATEKKRRNRTSSSTTKAQVPAGSEPTPAPADDGDPPQPSSDKKARFIVFIGNLPFTATKASLQSHFAAIQPTSIRLLSNREDPSKSRGIAFVEFDHYGRMSACLERYHHGEFDDGVSPPRKINVELTAGGGGKKAHRREKIQAKNAKLKEERAKRVRKEEKEKEGRRQERAEKGDHDDVHPSRRGQVPNGS